MFLHKNLMRYLTSPGGPPRVSANKLSGVFPLDSPSLPKAAMLRYLPEPLAYRTLSTRWASRHKVAPWKVCHKDY
jgi:hypothetical protein